MPNVVVINDLNFRDEVLNSELPVLVDVSAEWCGPCKVAMPVVAELARVHEGKLKVVTIDGDESPHLVASLGVRGFPTFVGFVGGKAVERRVGFAGKRALESMASALVQSQRAPALAADG